MIYFFLIAGIFIAGFGIIKYISLQQREGKSYKIFGLYVSEEVIWVLLFLIGLIFVIAFMIEKFEKNFLNRGH